MDRNFIFLTPKLLALFSSPATIRATKTRTDFSFKLNKTGFAKIDKEIKKELVKKRIVKVTYGINSSSYEELLAVWSQLKLN